MIEKRVVCQFHKSSYRWQNRLSRFQSRFQSGFLERALARKRWIAGDVAYMTQDKLEGAVGEGHFTELISAKCFNSRNMTFII